MYIALLRHVVLCKAVPDTQVQRPLTASTEGLSSYPDLRLRWGCLEHSNRHKHEL
eukprot:jgi/Botrbrau1/6132/Bobra.331_2s0027.1